MRKLTASAALVVFSSTGSSPVSGQAILPAHPDSKGGGNPLQGLGRPDDPLPSRYSEFAQQNEASSTSESESGNSTDASAAAEKTTSETGSSTESSQSSSGLFPIESTSEFIPDDPDAGKTEAGEVPKLESGDSKNSAPDQHGTEETAGEHGTTDGTTPAESSTRRNSVADSNLTEGEPKAAAEPKSDAAGRLSKFQTPRSQAIEKIKKELLNRQHAAKAHHEKSTEEHLVPPPPPIPAIAPTEKQATPERQALLLINSGSYSQAENQLKQLVATNADNFSARYLLAVTLVFRRKYDEAKSNYRHVIQNSKNKKLVELAEAGLNKIEH